MGHQLSQERQHGREVEAEWARRLDTARQQHRDNLASLAALVASQNKVPAYCIFSSLQLYLTMSGWSGVEERDVLPDHQVQHQAEGGAAEEQGAQGRAGEAAGQ